MTCGKEQAISGYMGKILRVDLSAGKLWDESLNEGYAHGFVGGSGLAARYVYDMVDGDTDPLGPDNPLVFMTGPLVGTLMLSAGRCSVCALSPLTHIWGEANTGGFFGPELRFAGYDGIIIVGQAEAPVWLSVVEGRAELHDASDLWTADSYKTQERVRERMGDPKARIACIGLAGENQALMAAVMNDHGRAVPEIRLRKPPLPSHIAVGLVEGDYSRVFLLCHRTKEDDGVAIEHGAATKSNVEGIRNNFFSPRDVALEIYRGQDR